MTRLFAGVHWWVVITLGVALGCYFRLHGPLKTKRPFSLHDLLDNVFWGLALTVALALFRVGPGLVEAVASISLGLMLQELLQVARRRSSDGQIEARLPKPNR